MSLVLTAHYSVSSISSQNTDISKEKMSFNAYLLSTGKLLYSTKYNTPINHGGKPLCLNPILESD